MNIFNAFKKSQITSNFWPVLHFFSLRMYLELTNKKSTNNKSFMKVNAAKDKRNGVNNKKKWTETEE